MSSFNINTPSAMPQIKEAQTMKNNGGAGNTGYMAGGKKKKKKDNEIDPIILDEGAEDKFERSEDETEDDDYYKTNSEEFCGGLEKTDEEDILCDILETEPENKVKEALSGLVNRAKSVVNKVKNKKNIFDNLNDIQAPEDEIKIFNSGNNPSLPGNFLSLSGK